MHKKLKFIVLSLILGIFVSACASTYSAYNDPRRPKESNKAAKERQKETHLQFGNR